MRFTTRGSFTYAFVPREAVARGSASWDAHVPADGSPVHLLGHGPVGHRIEDGRVALGPLPETDSPCLVFRFLR